MCEQPGNVNMAKDPDVKQPGNVNMATDVDVQAAGQRVAERSRTWSTRS